MYEPPNSLQIPALQNWNQKTLWRAKAKLASCFFAFSGFPEGAGGPSDGFSEDWTVSDAFSSCFSSSVCGALVDLEVCREMSA